MIKHKLNLDSKEDVNKLSTDEKQSDINEDNETKGQQCSNSELEYYQAHIIEFKTDKAKIHTLENEKLKQVRIQFLYKEKSSKILDKLLVLVHQECKL